MPGPERVRGRGARVMFGSAGVHGSGGVRDGPLGAARAPSRSRAGAVVLLAAGVHRRRHRRLFRAAGRAVAAGGGGPARGDARLARSGRRAHDASLAAHRGAVGGLARFRARQAARRMGARAGADEADERRRGARLRGADRGTPGTRAAADAARHRARRSRCRARGRPACASPPTGRSPVCSRARRCACGRRLMPPAEPALPGDYDFGRQAWFAGIGAVGYAMSPPSIDAAAGEVPRDLALWAGRAALASGHRRAHRRGAAGRDRRHRHGADHRRARRHLRSDQRRVPRQRHPAHPVDLRLPHGDHGRLGVLHRALGARRVPVDRAALPDQEVGGGRRHGRGARLSAHLRRRLRHRPLDDHDLHHVHRRAARPPGAGPAQRHPGGDG